METRLRGYKGPLFLSNSVKPTQIHQIQQVSNPEAKKLVYFINKGHVIDLLGCSEDVQHLRRSPYIHCPMQQEIADHSVP